MRNPWISRKGPRPALPLSVLGLAAALVLAGCAPAPGSATAVTSPAPTASQPAPSPVITAASDMFSTLNAPRMDASADFTGQIVTSASADPEASLPVYDAPGGAQLAWLASDQSLPVVGHAVGKSPSGVHNVTSGGWTRVMLPSRRSLPSQTAEQNRPFINQGTGWVWDADVTTSASNTHIFVNASARNVTVGSLDGTWSKTFPAEIGANVPVGPTFLATGAAPETPCGDVALTFLSAQGTSADSLSGQSVNPTAIAGLSDDCVTATGGSMAAALPNMVRLTPDDAQEFATYAVAGTPVDVISADYAPDGTPNAVGDTGQIGTALDAAFTKAGR